MDKIKTLKLSPRFHAGDSRREYLVKQVTDSLVPHVGDFLNTKEAKLYCDSPAWKVTITEA